jgi:hypothetical protein
MADVGKMLMVVAGLLFLVGGLIFLIGRAGGGFLPGDVVVRRGNWTFAFPIVTCVIVSIVLTVLLNLIFRR